jgi:hypothetical protein
MKTTTHGAIVPFSTALLLFLLSLSNLGCSPEPAAVAPPPRSIEAAGAIIDALSELDSFKRIQKLSHLLPILGPAAVPQISDALGDSSVDIGAAEIALLTRAWAMHEPAKAMTYASTQSPFGLRLAATMPAAEEMAKRDPEAAVQRIGALMLTPATDVRVLQVALVRGWFDSGKPGLIEWIRDLGVGFPRQRALAAFARRKIRRDGAERVMRWAESLPDEPEKFKLNAFRQVAAELTHWDRAAGAAFCKAHCEGPFGSQMLMMVGVRWAAYDGPAAIQWLSRAPAGRVRDEAIRDTYRRWIKRDPDVAYAWAASIGRKNVEPWFGAVAEFYAMRISWQDPTEAMEWVAIIEDDQRRETSYITIARRWREKDESAAEAWVVQSPLSEEARDKARQPPNRNPGPRQKQKDPSGE